MQSTSVAGGLTFAFAADPYAYSNSTSSINTRALLAQVQDNVSCNVWENAEIDCSAIRDFTEPRYDLALGSTSATAARLEGQGCLLISSATAVAIGAANQVLGDLIMEFEVELYDSGPFSTGGVSFDAKVTQALRAKGYVVTLPPQLSSKQIGAEICEEKSFQEAPGATRTVEPDDSDMDEFLQWKRSRAMVVQNK